MEANICPRCGETLKLQGETLICSYCGASFQREVGEKASHLLRKVLDEVKMERLANCRRHMWDVAHEKYSSKEKVCDAANAVLSLHAEDFLARIYLHSHDRDPLKTNLLLAESEVSSDEAEEAFRWLLPSMSARMVGPLHDFIDRHFSNQDRIERINRLEEEAGRVAQGIYEPALPRDVFLCYSSQDMAKVVEVMDTLERNGLACFAAFRNLRHGKGAQEDYLSAIKTAMRSCEVLVFLSSACSRSMDCDDLKVDLPYLIAELPDKPRIEYLLDEYADEPYLVMKTLKKVFPSQERCVDMNDLLDRVSDAVEEQEKFRQKAEAERKKMASASAMSEEELELLRKEAEEKAREQFMKERIEKEAQERFLEEKRKEEAKRNAIPRIEGDFVYYGEYPQSEADPQIAMALQSLSKDENGYVNCQGKRYAESKGKYFLVEPIKWRILKKEGGEALLISDTLLDCHRFDSSTNVFASSEIRMWLNGEFRKNAFLETGDYLVDHCGDMVSLPSEDDMNNSKYGFASEHDRLSEVTPYSVSRGSFRWDKNGSGLYWTKTLRKGTSTGVINVERDGFLNWYRSCNENWSVRPIIRIRFAEELTKALLEEETLKQEQLLLEKRVAIRAKKSLSPEYAGDVVYYGKYPQSEVKDANTLRALKWKISRHGKWISYDGEEYAEVKGKYFLVEPIKWRVLKKEGGEAYLLSDVSLDCHRFDGFTNVFASSEIRTWLNGEFKKAAFPDGGTYMLKQDGDFISLPSRADMENVSYGFKSDASRKSKPTPYAQAKGACVEFGTDAGLFWTKTPNPSDSSYVFSVYAKGTIGGFDHTGSISIRPTLRIKSS